MKGIVRNLLLLLRFGSIFGLLKGGLLFFKIRMGLLRGLKIPGIRHPLTLRKGTSDLEVFFQVFINGEYDRITVSEPEIIIDGGANIGLFCILMKNRFPNARVICIEPDPENFALLQRNVSLYPEVYCEQAGLWDKVSRLKVFDKFGLGKWGIIVEEDPIHGDIAALSIDALLEKYDIQRVDLMKLDIEASEKRVFSANFENWLSKINMLVIELHDRTEDGCAGTVFTTVNQCFAPYAFSISGENVVIQRA